MHMSDYKIILGFITLGIATVSYSFYFRDIFLGKTKPHAFSWFAWSVLSGTVFIAQLLGNAGPGAWITGFTAVACFAVSVIASFKNEEPFKIFDWVSLLAALAALILWRFTGQPAVAVLLVSAAYCFGFLPTFRKGYQKPFQETVATFALNSLKFGISIFALNSLSVNTWLYPATLFASNGLFVIMLLARREQIKNN